MPPVCRQCKFARRSTQPKAGKGEENSRSGEGPDTQPEKNKRKRAKTTSRYKGVSLHRDKFRARIKVNGKEYGVGLYYSEAEAARAVDEARIYLKNVPVNFAGEDYDADEIRKPKDFDTFVKLKKDQAKQLTKATKSSRFRGVSFHHGRWATAVKHHNVCVSLGLYPREEWAAKVYDQGCIYEGGKAVNFPSFPYNVGQICQHKDFDEFVWHMRMEAEKDLKARQHSRFTGVSWNTNSWEAYVTVPHLQSDGKIRSRKVCLGHFSDEEEAAKAADKGRIRNGRKAKNYLLL